jgi:hypothetical protein
MDKLIRYWAWDSHLCKFVRRLGTRTYVGSLRHLSGAAKGACVALPVWLAGHGHGAPPVMDQPTPPHAESSPTTPANVGPAQPSDSYLLYPSPNLGLGGYGSGGYQRQPVDGYSAPATTSTPVTVLIVAQGDGDGRGDGNAGGGGGGQPTPLPEPGSVFGVGLLGLFGVRLRKGAVTK